LGKEGERGCPIMIRKKKAQKEVTSSMNQLAGEEEKQSKMGGKTRGPSLRGKRRKKGRLLSAKKSPFLPEGDFGWGGGGRAGGGGGTVRGEGKKPFRCATKKKGPHTPYEEEVTAAMRGRTGDGKREEVIEKKKQRKKMGKKARESNSTRKGGRGRDAPHPENGGKGILEKGFTPKRNSCRKEEKGGLLIGKGTKKIHLHLRPPPRKIPTLNQRKEPFHVGDNTLKGEALTTEVPSKGSLVKNTEKCFWEQIPHKGKSCKFLGEKKNFSELKKKRGKECS